MKDMKIIGVSGFFSSGSSAVIDFLSEFKDVYHCDAEIRIIKDPYGITELEQALVHHWELLNSSAAIQDFLWLCKTYDRKRRTPLSRAGLSYSTKICPAFMDFTYEYIGELTDFTYESDFYYQKIKKNYIKYVCDRIRYGIEVYSKGKIKSANRKNAPSYFSHPTEEQFLQATKEYLRKLFENCILDGENHGYVILDQAISTNDTDAINRYFNDAKLIIVDRDPRDMYVEDLEVWRENLDYDVSSAEAGKRYVKRHNALRENLNKVEENILQVRFERLVHFYSEETKRIINFTGLTSENHIMCKERFNPEISMKNIGIWEKYYKKYKDAIDAIESLLPEYCNNSSLK